MIDEKCGKKKFSKLYLTINENTLIHRSAGPQNRFSTGLKLSLY